MTLGAYFKGNVRKEKSVINEWDDTKTCDERLKTYGLNSREKPPGHKTWYQTQGSFPQRKQRGLSKRQRPPNEFQKQRRSEGRGYDVSCDVSLIIRRGCEIITTLYGGWWALIIQGLGPITPTTWVTINPSEPPLMCPHQAFSADSAVDFLKLQHLKFL